MTDHEVIEIALFVQYDVIAVLFMVTLKYNRHCLLYDVYQDQRKLMKRNSQET